MFSNGGMKASFNIFHSTYFTTPTTSTSDRTLILYPYRQQANAGLSARCATRWHHRNSRRRHRNHKDEPKPDEKIVIMVGIQDIKKRAAGFIEEAGKASEAAIKAVVQKGKGVASELWNDLRTSVAFQNDKRVVIVVRRSSLEFLANAFICLIFVVGAFNLFSRAAKKYRWDRQKEGVVRRDRSLGGRQVLVGKSSRSPLATVDDSRSEKVLLLRNKKMQQRERKKSSPMPNWWPAPDVPPVVSIDVYNSAQSQARALLQVILDHRMSGRDFTKEEIVQLRHICKTSGVTVSFEVAYVRDSFYRAAIDFVLSACSSFTSDSTFAQIGGEEATRFIAGLAGNIGINADRAATMVNAAVAACTRSTFLQVWALQMQGRDHEVEECFLKLARIHSLFTPEANSAEMEMVAEGLKRHLQHDERKQLLKMYIRVCGTINQRVAAEALGLIFMLEKN